MQTPDHHDIMSEDAAPITIWPPTTIRQTARQRLLEAIRLGGINWHREHNPHWRDNPWKDGISVDLEEDSVLEAIADSIIAHADPDRD